MIRMNSSMMPPQKVNLISLRDLVSQRLFPNRAVQPSVGPFANQPELCTKAKKMIAGSSFLNKLITERSTSKKKNPIQLIGVSNFIENQNVQHGSSSNAIQGAQRPQIANQSNCIVPNRSQGPQNSFFGRKDAEEQGNNPQMKKFSFFSNQEREKPEEFNKAKFGQDPFATNSSNLLEKLKPKKLKILLKTGSGKPSEVPLYRDSDLGLAYSYQVQSKGMVSQFDIE